MTTCWKCSSELSENAPRCGACSALNRAGETILNGIIRDDGEIVVYVAEDAPGHLVIDLRDKTGLLSRLPKPTKKNAIQSKGFQALWEIIVGDHPLLQEAEPQSYEIGEEEDAKVLHVEVHGLPAEPTPGRARSTNGISHHAEARAQAMQAAQDEEESEEEGEEGEGEGDGGGSAAPAPAAEPLPMAAAPTPRPAPIPAGDLPGMELAALPTGGGAATLDTQEIQRRVADLLREGERSSAVEELRGLLGVPDTARRLADNLFLYSLYGRLTADAGQHDAARDALQRAFELDPRDRAVLAHYGDLLEATDGSVELLFTVARNLLLHHRRQLDPEALATAYRRIGRAHLDRGELDRARVHFERALDSNGADREALDLLLKAVEAEGDPERVIRVRQRLLEQMREPAGRAMLRVAIGDDYLSRLNDVHRAMEAWEASIAEHPNAAALTRLARVAIEREDWERAVNTYMRMGATLDAPGDRAEAFLQAGKIYRHHMWNLDKAAEAFEKTLDLSGGRLEAFQELTSLLVEGEQWARLRAAYERMIQRTESAEQRDKDLLGALYRNLGHLLQTHIDDKAGAERAYSSAFALSPDNPDLLERLADLYASFTEDDPEKLQRALAINRKLLEGNPERLDLLERVGILYLRLKHFDPALCVFRVLDYMGQIDERARSFVQSHATNVFRTVGRTIDDAFFNAHLLDDDHDHQLSEILAIAREALTMLLAHDLEYYDLRAKHRIDKRQGLMFNNLYHDIAQKLGYTEAPPAYEKADLQGMLNGSLHPPGFLVGGPLLSGYSEKEVAFHVSKQLALFRPPSFLIQFRSMRDLQVIFYTIVKMFRPEVNIPMTKDMERVAKEFQKLKPARFNRLQELMLDLLQRGQKLNLGAVADSFENASNRCALLFCDDLRVCRDMLKAEPLPVNPQRELDDRMAILLRWSTSDAYFELRKTLGIAIE